ncbi:MAG: hypothetical protein J0H16_15010, partial [Alicycliphilus denitrificans]|nr:hypothetical protein [Alicycliphilus denitrificans]
GAEVAPQGLKRACKPCQSGLSSGLRRNQATFRSTSGCVGLANGVLQTFPKRLQCLVAEHFPAGADAAVAVEVEHHESVVGRTIIRIRINIPYTIPKLLKRISDLPSTHNNIHHFILQVQYK